jgi:hypothetical protein
MDEELQRLNGFTVSSSFAQRRARFLEFYERKTDEQKAEMWLSTTGKPIGIPGEIYFSGRSFRYYRWPRASFNGLSNYRKSRVLMVLYLYHKNNPTVAVTSRQIAMLSGASHAYCRARMGKFFTWGYVGGEVRHVKERPGWQCVYWIEGKGVNWCENVLPSEMREAIEQEIIDRYAAMEQAME